MKTDSKSIKEYCKKLEKMMLSKLELGFQCSIEETFPSEIDYNSEFHHLYETRRPTGEMHINISITR